MGEFCLSSAMTTTTTMAKAFIATPHCHCPTHRIEILEETFFLVVFISFFLMVDSVVVVIVPSPINGNLIRLFPHAEKWVKMRVSSIRRDTWWKFNVAWISFEIWKFSHPTTPSLCYESSCLLDIKTALAASFLFFFSLDSDWKSFPFHSIEYDSISWIWLMRFMSHVIKYISFSRLSK